VDVNQAKAEHEEELLSVPGVVGVGVGQEQGEDVVVVLVQKLVLGRNTPVALGLPARLEGYRLVLREVGRIEAQQP